MRVLVNISAISTFRTDELKVLVPADHALANRRRVGYAETLAYEHVVLRPGTHLHFQMLESASEAGRTLRAKVKVSSYDALCRMVQVGLGIGILPAGNAELYLAARQAFVEAGRAVGHTGSGGWHASPRRAFSRRTPVLQTRTPGDACSSCRACRLIAASRSSLCCSSRNRRSGSRIAAS